MTEFNILSFDEVSGFDSGKDEVAHRYMRVSKRGIAAPCDDCLCAWVCAGSDYEDGKPDWSLAMACSAFNRFIQATGAARKSTVNPNKMTIREVYLWVFG